MSSLDIRPTHHSSVLSSLVQPITNLLSQSDGSSSSSHHSDRSEAKEEKKKETKQSTGKHLTTPTKPAKVASHSTPSSPSSPSSSSSSKASRPTSSSSSSSSQADRNIPSRPSGRRPPTNQAARHRHRKGQTRDIEAIKNPTIKRLAQRAGVKRVREEIYDAMRAYIRAFLVKTLNDTLLVTGHARRRTVTHRDVIYALRNRGMVLLY